MQELRNCFALKVVFSRVRVFPGTEDCRSAREHHILCILGCSTCIIARSSSFSINKY